MDPGKVDPDYESYNSALQLNEKEDQKENLLKVKKIIEEEYSKEIMRRQDQIENIELQICRVRKLLHLLRYMLIMSYYKKKDLEYSCGDDEQSTSDTLIAPDKQNRIHPAIKKLLGKNVHNLDHLTVKDKRKSSCRSSVAEKLSVSSPQTKKIKLDLDVDPVTPDKTCDTSSQETHLDFIRKRKKTKHRIVVGNISKWMPSSEEDVLTHKWMVYIRGPKEQPDVSHIIEKVIFYLHPSYKPHDVVEVSETPFHLSRRGWGEFPVRVQIFFKVTLNKPIDVVHNIKLDKTYTGQQTLGNETVIDVFLYDNNHVASEQETESYDELTVADLEDVEIDVKIESYATSSGVEHDYCYEKRKVNRELRSEHSYSLNSTLENLPKPKKDKIEQDESNALIYGLDKYLESNCVTDNCHKTLSNFTQFVQLNRKDIKFNNTKIIVFGKKIEGCMLTNFNNFIQSKKIKSDQVKSDNVRVVLPKNRFKNMGEALPYLFKRLPLCSELANNVNYKRTYPFTASSLKEFVSWNVGKRRSSEWSRARTIKKLLVLNKIHGVENWSTKTILMYGRSHDYTPFISYGLFGRDSEEKEVLLSCYASSCQIDKNHLKNISPEESEVFVNVDSDNEVTVPSNKPSTIDISDPHLKLECSYVRQTALDCGIVLKPEEIDDGVKFNGAEVMILEAVKCLAENLIRRARNHRVCTKIFSSSTSPINKEDVEVALNERPEIVSIRHFRKERANAEYFS